MLCQFTSLESRVQAEDIQFVGNYVPPCHLWSFPTWKRLVLSGPIWIMITRRSNLPLGSGTREWDGRQACPLVTVGLRAADRDSGGVTL